MAEPITITTNQREFNKELSKAGIALQRVQADAINTGARNIQLQYKNNLRRSVKLKNKFSLNSTKLYQATPISKRTGQLRAMDDINARVFIRKMKGGKEHYLAKMEEGIPQPGNSKTENKVPVPLNTARTGQSEYKPIANANRLLSSKGPQTLRAGGKKFGVKNDGFKGNQRFAILQRYRQGGTGRFTGDITKPFFFITNKGNRAVFRWIRGKFRVIRLLNDSYVKVKANPQFEKAVESFTPQKMDSIYRGVGKRMLMGIGD